MKTTTRRAFVFLVLLTAALFVRPAMAQEAVEHPDVTIGVEGLACPICAYGLEKSLKKIDTVQAVSIHIKDGEVRMKLRDGAAIVEGDIRKAVVDAGFTLTTIAYRDKKAGSRAKL